MGVLALSHPLSLQSCLPHVVRTVALKYRSNHVASVTTNQHQQVKIQGLKLEFSHQSFQPCLLLFIFSPHLLFSQSSLYSWVFQRSCAFSNCSFCLESPSLSSSHPSLRSKFLSIQKHSAQAVLRALNKGTTSAGGSTLAYLQQSIPCSK